MPGRVVHCRKETFDVLIDRTTKWGNPFKINPGVTDTLAIARKKRQDVIERYEAWFPAQTHLVESLWELRGRIIACWCAPQPCHGDFLVRAANDDLLLHHLLCVLPPAKRDFVLARIVERDQKDAQKG